MSLLRPRQRLVLVITTTAVLWSAFGGVALAAHSVSGVTPSELGQGVANRAVTVSGTGFLDGSQVSFSGPGITVHSTTVDDDTTLTVNLSVAADALTSARDVVVDNGGVGVDEETCVDCFAVNAAPTLDSVAPASRAQGALEQILTLTGTGFVDGAEVDFSGAGIAINDTNVVSATEITVDVSIDPAAATGARNVTVTNPDEGSATCTECFSVNAAPAITSISPTAGSNAGSVQLTINGSDFAASPTITLLKAGQDTIEGTSVQFLSSTVLKAVFNLALAAPGAWTVRVRNADAGMDECVGCFTVASGVPDLTGVTPAALGQGVGDFDLTLAGSNFARGISVTFSGTGITVNSTTVDSASSMTVNVSVDADAPLGARTITVENTDGQSAACTTCFSINAAPTLTSIDPVSRGQGALEQILTLTGTGFVDGATVDFSGTGITVNDTTFVSATELTLDVSIGPAALTGARDATVTNPDHGSATCADCFTINAAPTLASIAPASRGQGALDQILTLTGTGFVEGATVDFSGTGITVNDTTFVSATELTLDVDIDPAAATGARDVTVTNPDAGSATCTGCFAVNAVPTVTGADPAQLGQDVTTDVTINGTGFVPTATVEFSGTDMLVNTVTLVSATEITANVTVDPAAVLGLRDITVDNNDGSDPVTCTECFTVAAKPSLDTIVPGSLGQGALDQILTLTGTGFADGATVAFSGAGVTINDTTVDSPTQISLDVSIEPAAGTGARDVTVTNPDLGSATCTECFAINAMPTAVSVTPSSLGQGALEQILTLTGTDFAPGATVEFSGSGIGINETTIDSPTQITLDVSIDPEAAIGARDITVTNPDQGSAACTDCFTINAAPTLTSIDPASRGQGALDQILTLTGTGFVDGAEVEFSGAGILINDTTFVSPTEITLDVSIDAAAATGARTITITNPDQGSATCTDCFAINAAPTLDAIDPVSRGQGALEQVLTLTGTGFADGATVAFEGTGITVNSTTVDSPTQITLDVSIGADALTGARDVTVTNPDMGSATCTECLTINAKPIVTSASPAAGSNSGSVQTTLAGSDFFEETAVLLRRAGQDDIVPTTIQFLSATSIRVTLGLALAAPGSWDIVVTNPDAGTSTCAGCFTVAGSTPALTGVTPAALGQGVGDFDLELAGSNFARGISVTFSGTGITLNSTTVDSAQALTVNVTLGADAPLGARDITVENTDGQSATCADCFTVNAAPTLASIAPASLGQGALDQLLTLTGTGFADGATVDFQGTGITVNDTTFDSPTEITLDVSIDPAALTGARDVTVTNPDLGSATCADCFTINAAPALDANAVAPVSRGQGALNQVLTLTGSGFANGAMVAFSGTGITVNSTTVDSPTQITLDVSIDADALTGARDVTVTNPDGGSAICTDCFAVNTKALIDSIAPVSRGQGALNQVLTLTGTGFADAAAVAFSGTGITLNSTTVDSPTQITLDVSIDPAALTGPRDVNVINPDGAPAATCNGCFTINAAPTLVSIAPVSRGQGALDQLLTLTGSGFADAATVAFSGTGITVNSATVDSPTQITLDVSIDPAALTGARDVTVTNPDGAPVATCTGCFTINAAPALDANAVAPVSRGQGALNQVLTLTGSGFANGATAAFSGTGITVNSATVDSPTQITLDVSIDADALTGARDVSVTNADGSPAAMCTECFTINAKAVLDSLAPPSLGQGALNQILTLTGSGFVGGTTVAFSGTGITVNSTTVDLPTQMTLDVSIDPAALAGPRDVSVTNPDGSPPGACNECFTINALPTLTSIAPLSRGQGALNQVLTLTGTGFANSATVAFEGTGILVNTTTVDSPTQITLDVSIDPAAAIGARNVSVTNPDGSPAAICAECFRVKAAAALDSIVPATRGQGALNQVLTLTGSGFVNGATAAFSGTGITVNSTTVDSPTQMTLDVSIAPAAVIGARDVTVTNDDGSPAATCTGCFAINTKPTLTAAAPAVRGQGALNQILTLTGSGFVNGASASFSGTGITVNSATVNSPTQITLNVSLAPSAATGARSLTVTNPDGGPATCAGCFSVTARPIATITAPTSITGAASVAFDHTVRGITASNVSMRPVGGSSLLTFLTCRNAARAVVACSTGAVRTVTLDPLTNLIPGQRYTVAVAPAGTAIVDDLGGRAVSTSEAFRASLVEDELSAAARYILTRAWERRRAGAAFENAYMLADRDGAAVEFRFRGTGIDWYTAFGPSMGRAAVFVDGVHQVTVDNYAARLSFGERRAIRGLDEGVHTLRIVVQGRKRLIATGTSIVVDRWVVRIGAGAAGRRR